MSGETHSAAEFYATIQGAVAARLLRERLSALWPNLSRQSVLGIGFPGPYLRLWRDEAQRCIAFIPPQAGPQRWPAGAASLACTGDDEALPFPDLSFDRVLLVHGLEAAGHARRLLREVWRVLRDDGRLLVVAPNRRGMWAHVESTPFGQGQPYSPGQIGRLLRSSMFAVERRDTALYVPPTSWRMVLRGAAMWEAAGRRLVPRHAGVTLTEATKDVFSALPLTVGAGRRVRKTVIATSLGMDALSRNRPVATSGAGEGIRTLDPNLGKVVLYP